MSSLDFQTVNTILTEFIQELMTTKGGLPATKPCAVVSKPIDTYESRMLVKAQDKFEGSAYIAVIGFYLNAADIKTNHPQGTMVCYVDTEVADKIFKAAGLPVPYDEDEASMLDLLARLCQQIADALKERLGVAGYHSLETSAVDVYKNTAMGGVAFCTDQKEKQELSFYFLKHKALVIDWTMTAIPKKI